MSALLIVVAYAFIAAMVLGALAGRLDSGEIIILIAIFWPVALILWPGWCAGKFITRIFTFPPRHFNSDTDGGKDG